MNAVELQSKLGIDRKTLDGWIADGLPHSGKGKRLSFDDAEVAAWLVGEGHAQPRRIVSTEREVAEHFEVSDRSVRRWKDDNMPWQDGAYDLDAIADWRERRHGEASKSQDAEDRAAAETRKAAAAADLAELKLAERRRELIPVEMPTRVLLQVVHAIRTHIEQFPDKLHSMLGDMPQRHKAEVLRVCRAGIQDTLRAIQGTIRSRKAEMLELPEGDDDE
jgi:phage terminase Nu1 subunit (DNA packaging protein)